MPARWRLVAVCDGSEAHRCAACASGARTCTSVEALMLYVFLQLTSASLLPPLFVMACLACGNTFFPSNQRRQIGLTTLLCSSKPASERALAAMLPCREVNSSWLACCIVWIYSFGPLPAPSPVPLGKQSWSRQSRTRGFPPLSLYG